MDKPSITTKIIAGGIAGASETLVTYPAEFVKTRRQLPQFAGNGTSSFSILKSTYRVSGISGFYSGCQALVVSNAFKSGIRFLSFETSKDYLDRVFRTTPETGRNPWVNILSGLGAGVAESILVVTPGEALKTKIIQDAAAGAHGRFAKASLVSSAGLIVREDGIRALWRGLGPVLCKQGTNSAVRFTTFGMLQEQVAKRRPTLDGNMGMTLGLGAISGVVTVYASMPFDNIKTRMQSVRGGYKSMLDCAVQTFAKEGIGAFWRGTSPRLVRLTLSSGITFTIYDQIVRAVKTFQAQPHRGGLYL